MLWRSPLKEGALNRDPALKDSFDALTLYKKREDTRQNRLEKSIPMIRDGIGQSDKYRE